jgi:glycosyltransferase involved in cell wall biosynthesis
VLKHAVNRGQGAALQTGNEFAIKKGAQAVVHFDADGQFNPADILPALQMMREGNVDVVLGSRFLDTRSRIPWTKKYILLPISRLINRFLTGLYLTDVHNGFRILSRRALEKINISQDRMAHNSDIVKQIKEKGLVYIEHPVEVVYHEYGQGLSGGVQILQDIAKAKIFK